MIVPEIYFIKHDKYRLYHLRKCSYAFEKICQFATDRQRKQSSKKNLSKMRHFTFNLVVNIIGAILFLVMGIALIVGFVLNQSIVEELQQVTLLVFIMMVIHILLCFLVIFLIHNDDLMQAANFDNWNPFILCAGILALFTAGVFILGSWKVIEMIVMVVVILAMLISYGTDKSDAVYAKGHTWRKW